MKAQSKIKQRESVDPGRCAGVGGGGAILNRVPRRPSRDPRWTLRGWIVCKPKV